jgi:transposase InsO family protein
MKTDFRRFIQDCEHCENEKGKRRLAHGMFSGHDTAKPRSRYSMDFQGQGKAITGETEALAIIDSFTKTVFVIALPNHEASTLVPRLLDEIFFRRGAPDIIHSDEAQEFMSELLSHITVTTGTARTTTCGHNAQSNGEILSPTDYERWPSFSQRICFAYNSVPHESIGDVSPLEMDFGAPSRLCFRATKPHGY